MEKFNWTRDGANWICKPVANITLCVSPSWVKNGKAARGCKWHAQATRWDDATNTATRYGRDEYTNLQESADAAKRLASDIFKTGG